MTSTTPIQAPAVSLEDLRRATLPVRREANRCERHPLHSACAIIENATPAWGIYPMMAAHLYLRDEADYQLRECGNVEQDVLTLLSMLKRYVEQNDEMYFQDGAWHEMVHGKMVEVPEAQLRCGPQGGGGGEISTGERSVPFAQSKFHTPISGPRAGPARRTAPFEEVVQCRDNENRRASWS